MQRRDGFTLIEIVIAIAILVVALLMAVPSLKGVLADRRLRRSLDTRERGRNDYRNDDDSFHSILVTDLVTTRGIDHSDPCTARGWSFL